MKIQGHRGTRVLCPENTMEAFDSAYKLGACGIELDVNKLNDGNIIVCHDANLERMCGFDFDIFAHSTDEVRDISIGYEYGEKFINARVPYFEDVLKWICDKDFLLNTEIKSQPDDNGICDDVIRLLEKYNMKNKCSISSFNEGYLSHIKKNYPDYNVAWLLSNVGLGDIAERARKKNYNAINPYHMIVTKELVKKCHKYDIAVNAWTVNKEDDIIRMYECGVDTIISDDVENAMKVVASLQK